MLGQTMWISQKVIMKIEQLRVVRNLQCKRVLLKIYTYKLQNVAPQCFQCTSDKMQAGSTGDVQLVLITKSLSFQVHSSVSGPHCWLGVSHLSSKAPRSSAVSPALPYGLLQNLWSKCFLVSAIAGNVGVCMWWGLSAGNNFRIPRRDGWLSCTTSVFSSKCMTPNHYLI